MSSSTPPDEPVAPAAEAPAVPAGAIRLPGIEPLVALRVFPRASAWLAVMRVARDAVAEERQAVPAGKYSPSDDELLMPHVLAAAVMHAEGGQPVQSAELWDAWGARHLVEYLSLYNDVMRANGADEKAARGN